MKESDILGHRRLTSPGSLDRSNLNETPAFAG